MGKPVDLGVGLSFDDVLLVPEKGTASSREDLDTSIELFPGLVLRIPIISANMDTVTEGRMAAKMEELGGMGIPHRFCPVEEQVSYLKKISDPKKRFVNIGSGTCEFSRLERAMCLLDGQVGGVLVDIAHGHSNNVLHQAEKITRKYPGLLLMGGNVATREGARDLVNAGFHSVKTGVGSGMTCKTRMMTGCGVPQLTAIQESREGIDQSENPGASLIADGGINYPGDLVKALAFGADAIMVGGILAGTDETPGRVIEKNFTKYKMYRGMASKSAIEERGLKPKAKYVEGVERWIEIRGPVELIIQKFTDGLRSGMSYLGCDNIKELRENVRYHRMSSNGFRESFPNLLL